MDRQTRLKRLHFRAHHRGTREADYLLGGYFDAHAERWSDAELDWFETFLEEQDVDILAWAMKSAAVPERWNGPAMAALQKLDFIRVST